MAVGLQYKNKRMRFQKVVYLSYLPLRRKIYQDLYIAELQKEGIGVEYWDLTDIYWKDSRGKYDIFDDVCVCEIKSFAELERKIKNRKEISILYIPLVSYTYNVLKLYKLLTHYKCSIGRFARGMIPAPEGGTVVWKQLKKITLKKVRNHFLNYLAVKAKCKRKINTCDYMFLAGSKGYKTLGLASNIDLNFSQIIDINTVDYDTYVEKKSSYPLIDQRYAVFLDEYLPFHPDFEMLNMPTLKEDEYYPQLNTFFDRIEKKYNLKVVIAAHPKAKLYHVKNPYGERQVIFNETCNLVVNADFVMAHNSTAIEYAVMANKAVLFLHSQELINKMPVYDSLIQLYARELAQSLIKFDCEEDINFLDIDKEKYKIFLYNYLTSETSKDKLTRDIFLSFLKQE